jgi:Fur family ferric uptake transcriptional regulator
MNQTNQQLENVLKQNNYYVTRPRKRLLEALSDAPSPLSVKEIAEKTDGQVSRASIYRTLQTLIKLNIIKRITIAFSDKYELSDRFKLHHHYLSCEKCGRTIPIKLGDKMENAIQSFGSKNGFKIKSHEVELRGLCRYCR